MINDYIYKIRASAIQEQFWINHSLNPDKSCYNIPSLFLLHGEVDINALRKSIEVIVARHEIFRTVFCSEDGEIVQVIKPDLFVPLIHQDLIGQGFGKDHDIVQGLIQREVDRPFDLTEGPLFRCLFLELSAGEALLLFVLHHIITDLHSVNLFVRKLSDLYNAAKVSSGPQYAVYSQWQRQWMETDEYKQMLTSWQDSLSHREGYLNLPLDNFRPPEGSPHGGVCYVNFEAELVEKLYGLARKKSVNLFLLLLASYYVLLYRYSHQAEIIVGVPFTNRRRAYYKEVLGCFVNILPIIADIQPGMNFNDLLQLLRKEMLIAHRRQEVPYVEIVGSVQGGQSTKDNSLFQVGFTFQPPVEMGLQGAVVSGQQVRSSDVQLDLFPVLWEGGEGVAGFVEFKSDLFHQDTIDRFVEHWKVLLTELVEDENAPLSQLNILGEKERDTIIDLWNSTGQEYPETCCLHTLFEEQVNRTPAAPALFVDGYTITYQELNERANQLGHYLQRHGIGPDSLVGVCMERSLEMVIALYGILKAGGAYVPFDPTYPADRLSFMMEDADFNVILTQEHIQDRLSACKGHVICLDSQWQIVEQERNDTVLSGVKADNLAYVIYTSGSTGHPKGVMNQHNGICNRLFWMQDEFHLNGKDRVLQKTPYSFDVSVWEFFWPLQVGASLVIAPPESHYDPAALVRLIDDFAITTIHFVPSMLQAFLNAPEVGKCQSLKRLICSGEALSHDLQNKVFDRLQVELYNLYGPTEAAVDVTSWHCQQESDRSNVPIGKPIANTRIYIVDEFMQPTPIGVPGELLIGGVQVARGYLNRPELTETNFIDDVFSYNSGGKLYKTGDLAKFLPDGTIEYLGRLDHQVKLHGLRIELGEIEAVISNHVAVQQAVVCMVKTVVGDKALAAYVVLDGSKHFFVEDMERELKGYLGEKLPHYMVPTFVIEVDRLPLTASGKVDRNALPKPPAFDGVSGTNIVANDKFEIKLYQIWRQLLKHGNVRRTDSFFDVGGNSLVAVMLVSEINKKFKTEIPVVKLFQYPTIESFARFMSKAQDVFSQEELLADRSHRQRAFLASRRKMHGR